MIGMGMGETDKVNRPSPNNVQDTWPTIGVGRMGIDDTNTAVGKLNDDCFAVPRFEKINPKLSRTA